MRASLPVLALLLLAAAASCARSNARQDAGAANRQSGDARAATEFDAGGGSSDIDSANRESDDASPSAGFDSGGSPQDADTTPPIGDAGSRDSGVASPPSADASPSANDGSRDSGVASPPSADASPSANDGSVDAGAMRGETSRAIACGERWMHDTTVHGQADTFRLYGCTARAESGRETVYSFRSPDACRVSARLRELHTDLDLFLLSAADALSCEKASSTPIDLQRGERLIFDVAAGSTRILVVDGYARSVGSYTLELDCICGAAGATFNDGPWRLQVDRRWNGEATRVDSPATELSERDYQPVSNAAAHDVLVSDSWRQVSIGTAPWLGTAAKGMPGSLRYELTTGTVAGGRFVVWSSAAGLEAELTLYGSGVPIVSSERGRLVRLP